MMVTRTKVWIGFLGMFLFIGCQTQNNSLPANFKLILTDELQPVGIVPECIEVNQSGLMVILTNRFNTDATKYQKGYFINLSKAQQDTLQQLISQILKATVTFENETTSTGNAFKIHFTGLDKNQRVNYFWETSGIQKPFAPLIAYCRKLPEQNHRYKLKEPHYFSTSDFCTTLK